MKLYDLLFGEPLRSSEEAGEKLGPVGGLSVFGLDALSSAAYGPEAALTLLIPLAAAGIAYIVPIMASIIILLAIVYFSYRQTIVAYPSGGGSYTVARQIVLDLTQFHIRLNLMFFMGAEAIKKSLEGSGLRCTPQRFAVMAFLTKHTGHPTAAEIFAAVNRADPRSSRATTYNNLRDLVQAGLVREVAVEGRAARFDAKGMRHHHFICDRCGKVEDMEWYDVPRPASGSLGKRMVRECELIFRGLCAKCAPPRASRAVSPACSTDRINGTRRQGVSPGRILRVPGWKGRALALPLMATPSPPPLCRKRERGDQSVDGRVRALRRG